MIAWSLRNLFFGQLTEGVGGERRPGDIVVGSWPVDLKTDTVFCQEVETVQEAS